MKLRTNIKEGHWKLHDEYLRNPGQILVYSTGKHIISPKLLKYTISNTLVEILKKEKITLLVTREYEHLVIALTVENDRISQSFIELPHPSGLAIDRINNIVYIAATRNPNQIWEFKPSFGSKFLLPTRVKYFPGKYYLHDLALIGNTLYANSVGQNAVIKVDFNNNIPDKPLWWPKCVEDPSGNLRSDKNYIQLNSIGAGSSIADSFFSASASKVSRRLPGHLNFPVDKRGVLFSGETREVYAAGLTRPHSCRIYNRTVWVDNSGYGEVGFIENKKFVPFGKLHGWTRGLCFFKNIMFVGISKILPRFKHYAPGIKSKNQECGVVALDIKTGKTIGSIIWPYGNQIFSIDWISQPSTIGFPFKLEKQSNKKIMKMFYNYRVI